MTKEDIAALIERLEAKADEIAEDVDDDEAEQHWQEIKYMRQAAAALKAQQDEIERLRRRVMALTPTVRSEPLAQ